MDNKKRARVIVEEVLNLALNRHIHVLDDAGYLRAKKHSKDYGYARGGEPRPALKMKWALMDEICNRFELAIADYLEHPREQLWPLHNGTPKPEAEPAASPNGGPAKRLGNSATDGVPPSVS